MRKTRIEFNPQPWRRGVSVDLVQASAHLRSGPVGILATQIVGRASIWGTIPLTEDDLLLTTLGVLPQPCHTPQNKFSCRGYITDAALQCLEGNELIMPHRVDVYAAWDDIRLG